MQLSSKNKTILVLSDPHQEIDKLDYILKKENYDIAVCLGDYFDSFSHDTPNDLIKTCDFLKTWIPKDNFFTLFGNHDIHYLYDNAYTICSGFTNHKDTIISDELNKHQKTFIRDKFKWYIWIDDFLCSHAGINSRFLPANQKIDVNNLSEWLDSQSKLARIALETNQSHWFFRAGTARGGSQKVGGIVWQDFDIEFNPIDDLNQLVGHTPHPYILPHKLDGNLDYTECNNLDIDCHLNQYLLISNGKLTIKSYADL